MVVTTAGYQLRRGAGGCAACCWRGAAVVVRWSGAALRRTTVAQPVQTRRPSLHEHYEEPPLNRRLCDPRILSAWLLVCHFNGIIAQV